MLALLGWNPGTEQEIFSMEELINSFSLDRVGKSGSRFDPEKAKWFNHQYLQKKSIEELTCEFKDYLWKNGHDDNIDNLQELVGMVKERVSFVKDIWEQTDFFFRSPETYDQEVVKKRWKDDSPKLLTELRSELDKIDDFTSSAIESVIKAWIEEKGYNTGAIMNVLRLVIVGALRGPHMHDIISWIGKEETLKRIDRGTTLLSK
jgi:glutamyl-tRNA synthetase